MIFFDCHTHFGSPKLGSIFNSELLPPKDGHFSSGIHPWNADRDFDLTLLEDNLNNPRCLALGEIGLDKLKGPDLERQKLIFRQQLELNQSFHLPVILHEVRGLDEILQISKSYSDFTYIFHGFQKPKSIHRLDSQNIYLSIGRAILFKDDLQNWLRGADLDKILIESDEYSELLEQIYHKIAEIKQLSLLHLCERMELNFKRVFPKWQNGLNEQL